MNAYLSSNLYDAVGGVAGSSSKKCDLVDEEDLEDEDHDDDHDEDDEDEDGDEDAKNKKKKSAQPAKKAKRAKTSSKEGGGGGGGFKAVLTLSAPLSALLGAETLQRTQVVKGIWDYIKSNGLQDPSNKQFIVCDDMLRDIFEVDKVHMFTMNKVGLEKDMEGEGEEMAIRKMISLWF